jgi:hypothetical protein
VGKGKRADMYLEVRKSREAYIFLMKQVPVLIAPFHISYFSRK